MPHLYKFRSGRIVNLEKIQCVAKPPAYQSDKKWAVIIFETNILDISKEEYNELVEKCERIL